MATCARWGKSGARASREKKTRASHLHRLAPQHGSGMTSMTPMTMTLPSPASLSAPLAASPLRDASAPEKPDPCGCGSSKWRHGRLVDGGKESNRWFALALEDFEPHPCHHLQRDHLVPVPIGHSLPSKHGHRHDCWYTKHKTRLGKSAQHRWQKSPCSLAQLAPNRSPYL